MLRQKERPFFCYRVGLRSIILFETFEIHMVHTSGGTIELKKYNTHRLTLNNCCNVFSQARARDPHWKAISMRCALVKPIQHFYRYRYIRFKDLQFLFSRNVSLDYFKRCPPNWPFPNYLWSLFQSESWCSSFHMKTSFHLHVKES